MPETTYFREVELRYVGARRKAERITASPAVERLARKLVPDALRERFVAVYLDAKNRPIGYWRIDGGMSSCLVEVRDVIGAALRVGAVGLILTHNHPSGEPSPSADDVALTERIRRAANLFGIDLLDHVILGDSEEGAYFSFRDAGLLEAPRG